MVGVLVSGIKTIIGVAKLSASVRNGVGNRQLTLVTLGVYSLQADWRREIRVTHPLEMEMQSSLTAFVRRAGLGLITAVAFSASANAQVAGSFYSSYNYFYNASNPFPSGSLLCSTPDIGATTRGFTLNFTNANTRNRVCPSNPNALNPGGNIIGARLTGSLWAAVGGTYTMDFSADDGEVLWVNGIQYDYEWNLIKGGGPGTVDINLNAGKNAFVLDYNNSYYGGGFVRLNSLDSRVEVVTPEPSSVAMMAAGLALVAGAGYRRRRRAE